MEDLTILTKTERLLKAKWKKGKELVIGDFMPTGLPVSQGVYTMPSRVVPKTDGTFLVAVVNASNGGSRKPHLWSIQV